MEMEAEGQSEEFLSETEGNTSQESVESSDGEINSEQEILDSESSNNNTTIVRESEIEEGECSSQDIETNERNKEESMVEKMKKLIDQTIATSMTKFQSYVDQRLAEAKRITELERQLDDNRKCLEEIKRQGNEGDTEMGLQEAGPQVINSADGQSEITIYHNAVGKSRGSSSSEDDRIIDTSDEFVTDINASLLAEKELKRKQGDETNCQGRRSPTMRLSEAGQGESNSGAERFPVQEHHPKRDEVVVRGRGNGSGGRRLKSLGL